MRLFLFILPLLTATCTLRSEMPVDTGIVTSAPKSHTEDLEIPAYGEDEDIVLANTKRCLNRAWALLED